MISLKYIKAGTRKWWRKLKKKAIRSYRIATSRWRKLPDFIIIGTQKGGTTSLFACLRQHPAVMMSWQKEPHFFNTHFDKGLKWYRRFFPLKNSRKIGGEVTPCYMYYPKVPERMAAVLPNIKLIVMLRNPIDRAHSGYIMGRDYGWDLAETFEAALEQETRYKQEISNLHTNLYDNAKFNKIHDQLFYLERSKYYSQLNVWFKYFKREQFLFIKSEKFFENPQKELSKIYDFLEIDHIYPTDLKPRNARQYDLLSSKIRAELEIYFQEENEKLIELLGEEFDYTAY